MVHLDHRLSMCFGPILLFESETALDIPEGTERPDSSPDERYGPADHVGSILLESEDESSDNSGCKLTTNTPEQSQSVKHLAEVVTGFVSGVESLAELNVTTTVNGDNIFDDPVNSRTQLGTGRH